VANISIHVDDVVKQQAERICSELGLSLSTATNLFYKKRINYGGIPFELKVDPFFSGENQLHLEKVIGNQGILFTSPYFNFLMLIRHQCSDMLWKKAGRFLLFEDDCYSSARSARLAR